MKVNKEFINEHLMWYVKNYTYIFKKQLVYKQLGLRCQIAYHLLELNLFLLSNNENYRLKEIGVLPMLINVKLLLNRPYTTIQLSQNYLLGRF